MLRPFPLAFAAFALVLSLAGCASPRETRIQEGAALFRTLKPSDQALIREGLVDVGFTREMVLLALGEPTRRSTAETSQGAVETLVYRNVLMSPGSAQKLAFDTPSARPTGGVMTAAAAPGGPSLTSTQGSRAQSTLSDGSDNPVGTLLLELQAGRVTRMQMEP